MNSKSSPTVKQAALQAFNSLPDTFRGYELHRIVKLITGRKGIYIDSTLRKFRILKKQKKLNYSRIGSKDESHYQKTAVC